MKHIFTVTTLVVAATLAGGCATPRQTQTAVGAGSGAAGGAVLGALIGGSGKGAAIGAAVGAGAGTAVGYNWELIKEKLGLDTKDSGAQVTEETDGTLKVNLPDSISFSSGSASIDGKLLPILDKMATTFNEYPASTISIIGHTDNVGSAQANSDLSHRRADAVVDYLSQRGVQHSRMSSTGQGEAAPIADNATEAGRAQNRRVEILIHAAKS